ncbi:hypothetical protein WC29P3_00004 [Weissella phage WC29P3]|nr:hypothetical protein WC29P3_00004 [Weissella phage WC29P3]
MKKYKVTNQFMDVLNKWNDNHKCPDGTTMINQYTLNELPEDVTEWIFEIRTNAAEGNRRLGALINWINGEDIFEIRTKKYIVQRKVFNLFIGRQYISHGNYGEISMTRSQKEATRFDDFNKASEWANAHFEVVELDE